MRGFILDWETTKVFFVPESWYPIGAVTFVSLGVNSLEGVTWFLGGDMFTIEVGIEVDSGLDIELTSSDVDLNLFIVVREGW